jgi:ABC-type phosphate/phosphonate transport system substrate-binding protein
MIASLPMYDWPELREATDAWWAGLAEHFRRHGLTDVPDRLTREGDPAAAWESPDLLFSQTCGLPLTRHYRERLRIVATPCYAAEGCDGPTYSSVILVRADDDTETLEQLRGAVAAYNATDSLSGHLALRLVLAPLMSDEPFLAAAIETGSHAASMGAVAEGRADVCAIDCVSFAIAQRHRPALTEGLRRLARSPAFPALPYVTSASRTETELAALAAGLSAALLDPTLAQARTALLLAGAEPSAADRYAAVGRLDAAAPPLGSW